MRADAVTAGAAKGLGLGLCLWLVGQMGCTEEDADSGKPFEPVCVRRALSLASTVGGHRRLNTVEVEGDNRAEIRSSGTVTISTVDGGFLEVVLNRDGTAQGKFRGLLAPEAPEGVVLLSSCSGASNGSIVAGRFLRFELQELVTGLKCSGAPVEGTLLGCVDLLESALPMGQDARVGN